MGIPFFYKETKKRLVYHKTVQFHFKNITIIHAGLEPYHMYNNDFLNRGQTIKFA